MVDKRKIWAIFLFKFKMSHRAAEATRYTNNTFGPGLLINIQCTVVVQEVLQRRRESWRWGAQWQAIGGWQWPNERINEADALTTVQEVAQELNANNSMVIWHLKQIEKVENLNKWGPHELTENQKNRHFEVLFSLILHNNKVFLWLWHIMKSGFYTTISNDQISGWTKKHQALPKVKLTPKKGPQLLFGGLLLVWSTTALWIQVKPLHLRSMRSKLMRCIKICNACSQHWSTGRAQFSFVLMPDHTLYNQCFQSWTNWATKFCLIHHIHLTSFAKWLPLLQKSWPLFAGKHFHNQQAGCRKCFPRIHQIPKHERFYALGINKLISRWQKCVDCNVFY